MNEVFSFAESKLKRDSRRVAMANAFVESSHKMSLVSKRVLLCLIAKIDSRKPIPDTLHLSVEEYAANVGCNIKTAYRDIKSGALGLVDVVVRIRESDKIIKGNIAEVVAYFDREGRIECRFTSWFQPYIHYLHTEFTQYKLVDCRKMGSFYSIRLYEMLMQFKGTGKRTISVSKFRFMMGLKDDEYVQFKRMKEKIINPSVAEINRDTDWTVALSTVRAGRNIDTLVFTFQKSNQLGFNI